MKLLVTIGTDALDWLVGGRPNVAFDWSIGSANELRLAAARVDVTLKFLEAELDPWLATTF